MDSEVLQQLDLRTLFLAHYALTELFKLPTYTVLLISSILEGSTFPVRGGAVGTTVPIMEMRGWEGRVGGVKFIYKKSQHKPFV